MNKERIVIEIPRYTDTKYEIEKETGKIVLDRIVPYVYEFNYGYIPNTLWSDGDALDAVLLGEFSLHPLTEVDATPIAVIKMIDNGVSDYKVVFQFKEEVLSTWIWDVVKFFKNYKEGVEIEGFETDEQFIKETIQTAKDAVKGNA